MSKRGLISVFNLSASFQKESGACVKFSSWEKISSVLSQQTSGPVFFIANFHVCVEEKDIRVTDISDGERESCLFCSW